MVSEDTVVPTQPVNQCGLLTASTHLSVTLRPVWKLDNVRNVDTHVGCCTNYTHTRIHRTVFVPSGVMLSPSGLPEEDKVQTPAFTDAVRLYRQAQGHYGTWEMMCGAPSQVGSNM